MGQFLYILIPCQYNNQLLVIKSLGLQAEGDTPEQALLSAINSTALYVPLILGKFIKSNNWRGTSHLQLEVIFDGTIYNKINEIESLVNSSPTIKRQEVIVKPETAEVLRYGY